MLNKKLSSVIFMIILFAPSTISVPQSVHALKERVPVKDGFIGFTAIQSDIEYCQDAVFLFVHCDMVLDSLPSDGDFKGTVVVMDDGLSVRDWQELTSPLYGIDVEILTYLTPDANEGVDVIHYDPSLPLTSDQWNEVLDYDPSNSHGRAVISALASIAKKARIIFVNLALGDSKGFANPEVAWQWLLDNVATYDIVSMSYSSPNMSDQEKALMNQLAQRGVFMVTTIGNDGVYAGDAYPQALPYVYAVGSVDHEDRYSRLQEASMGDYSGSAPGSPFSTSYGSNDPSSPEIVDFAMPGNGVPVYVGGGQWVYSMGTSFSTPYLAASVLIAIYAYNLGFSSVKKYFSDPSTSELYQLLKDSASSKNAFSIYNGWGWIYLDILYDLAYQRGKDMAASLGSFF